MSDTPNTEPSEALQPALDEGYSRRFLTDKGPIAWMAKNHVASNIVMVIILVGGLMMALQLKKEVFPEFDMDYVAIHIAYPGASPEEVEQGMLLAIEEELRGLDGIKQVTGVASENFASVYTELEASASPERLVADIKNAVDRIPSFPEDAERPVVSLMTNKREVISLAIHGETDEASLRVLGEQLRDMLLQRPEITQVELGGTRPVEVSVEIPLETLRRYGLTLDQVARKIRQTAIQVPAGVVKTRAVSSS